MFLVNDAAPQPIIKSDDPYEADSTGNEYWFGKDAVYQPWELENKFRIEEEIRRNRDPLGNFLAGVVNSVVPGSNLGDEDNAARDIGEAVGGVGSLFVNPGNLLLSAATKATKSMSFLSSAINFVGKVAAGPVGSLGSNIINAYASSLLTPTAQTAAFQTTKPANIAENYYRSAATQAAFGNVKVTATTETAKPANDWIKPVAIGAGVLVAGFFGYKLLTKRK